MHPAHLMCKLLHASMRGWVFMDLSECKQALSGHPAGQRNYLEGCAFDVCPTSQRGLRLWARKAVC